MKNIHTSNAIRIYEYKNKSTSASASATSLIPRPFSIFKPFNFWSFFMINRGFGCFLAVSWSSAAYASSDTLAANGKNYNIENGRGKSDASLRTETDAKNV